jgi:hypothetical protein
MKGAPPVPDSGTLVFAANIAGTAKVNEAGKARAGSTGLDDLASRAT